MAPVSDKVRRAREKLEKKKAERRTREKARAAKRERKRRERRERVRDAASPVTDRVQSAKEEAQLTKEELGKLSDEVVPKEALREKAEKTQDVTSRAAETAEQTADGFDAVFGVDADDDGTIDQSELAFAMDTDGDGEYSSDEVVQPLLSESDPESGDEVPNGLKPYLLPEEGKSGEGGQSSGYDDLIL